MSATLLVGLGLFAGLFVWYTHWARGLVGVVVAVPLLLWLAIMILEVLSQECAIDRPSIVLVT